MKTSFLAAFLLSTLTLASCQKPKSVADDYISAKKKSGDSTQKIDDGEGTQENENKKENESKEGSVEKNLDPNLTYANVKAKVLEPYCTPCHGTLGGVSLETLAEVKSFAKAVKYQAVTTSSMPASPLPADLKKLLGDWIDAGTPE